MQTIHENLRGLSNWEFEQLKLVVTAKLSFKVKMKHYMASYLGGGSVDIQPTKEDKYYWNKERFKEVLDLVVSVGADYNRSNTPENMLQMVFCNGFNFLKFRVDEYNIPFIPGMVPVLCKKHRCFQSKEAAENYIKGNEGNSVRPLMVGMHSKDGYVVYEPSCDKLHISEWVKETYSNINKKDIWGKKDYHYRLEAVVTNFTPVESADDDGIEYRYDKVMVYRYMSVSGEEYISEREYLPWSDEEIRNVELPGYLRKSVEKFVEDQINEDAVVV